MGFNAALLEVGATAMRSAATHAQLHTGDPGAAGTSNLTTASRRPISWADTDDGDMDVTTPIAFTGGAANGAATHLSFWSGASGGTYYGSVSLGAGTTFNAEGELNVTSISGTASSTG